MPKRVPGFKGSRSSCSRRRGVWQACGSCCWACALCWRLLGLTSAIELACVSARCQQPRPAQLGQQLRRATILLSPNVPACVSARCQQPRPAQLGQQLRRATILLSPNVPACVMARVLKATRDDPRSVCHADACKGGQAGRGQAAAVGPRAGCAGGSWCLGPGRRARATPGSVHSPGRSCDACHPPE